MLNFLVWPKALFCSSKHVTLKFTLLYYISYLFIKIGAKLVFKKESVGDHSDLRQSMKRFPDIQIHDDACTLARYMSNLN